MEDDTTKILQNVQKVQVLDDDQHLFDIKLDILESCAAFLEDLADQLKVENAPLNQLSSDNLEKIQSCVDADDLNSQENSQF